MAASSSTWVVVQSRNYRFWIFLAFWDPFWLFFLVGEQPGHLGVHFYMNKTLNYYFYDNRENDEQWRTNWCDIKSKIFGFVAFFDILRAIIGTNFGMNRWDTESVDAIQSAKIVGFDLTKHLRWLSSHPMTQVVKNVTNQCQILVHFSSCTPSIWRILLGSFGTKGQDERPWTGW